MFSIFEPAFRDVRPQPRTQDVHAKSQGLDGQDERSLTQSRDGQPPDGQRQHPTSLGLSATQPVKVENSLLSTEAVGEPYHTNYSPRKRRKVSACDTESPRQSVADPSSHGVVATDVEPHPSDNKDTANASNTSSFVTEALHKPKPGLSSPKRSQPKKSTTPAKKRREQFTNASVQEQDEASGNQRGDDPAGSGASLVAVDAHNPKPESGISTPGQSVMLIRQDGTLGPPSKEVPTCPPRSANSTIEKKPLKRHMKMKNGKFVQSFKLILFYGHDQSSKETMAQRIDEILSSSRTGIEPSNTKTHPFFLGKKSSTTSCSPPESIRDPLLTDDTDRETDVLPNSKTPVAWRDMKFTSNRGALFKSIDALNPIWPPRDCQVPSLDMANPVLGKIKSNDAAHGKLKSKIVEVQAHEDVLLQFICTLKENLCRAHVFKPRRLLLSGNAMAQTQCAPYSTSSSLAAMSKMHSYIANGTSAFDRGETSGQQAWTSKYAPIDSREVLQPSCQILRDWLKSLAVHHVKSGAENSESKPKEKRGRKKRRPKRASDDLDDFIVDDADENPQDTRTLKNAILIAGPPGCGKTASVFAVAKELGFEVFEIHPGMRRSAKDIFDKVGDMTQNHLVQRNDNASRSSSVAPADISTVSSLSVDKAQPSMSSFLGSKKVIKELLNKHVAPSSTSKEQKQSVILFEEVDILFDSDKSFWTGVQNLTQQSKRPVIMTCNDITRIPTGELDLYTILHYQAPPVTLATEYLRALVAAEGHLIDAEAIATLYASKHNDLRAAITELSFWCQMTVGSRQGGLDWMFASGQKQPLSDENGEKLRICSEGTFEVGLDVVPEVYDDQEQLLRHCQDNIDLPISDCMDNLQLGDGQRADRSQSNLERLDVCATLYDARSVLDLIDSSSAAKFGSAICNYMHQSTPIEPRARIVQAYIEHSNKPVVSWNSIVTALDPITVEKPTFPPSHGRLAPSVEAACPAITVDIAPYIRAIVSFDKRLEQHRDELSGSQGKKARHTRAARAAAEGGDKAHTRAERWFPKDLDFSKVLGTGGDWPMWLSDSSQSHQEAEMGAL